MTGSHHPTATYRIQLRPGFGFAEAAQIVPYLAELGVSHLYLSPVLQAAPGSTHGYDVVDPTRLSAELGGEESWARLVRATRDAGLGIVIDIVPNHVAIPLPEQHNAAFWSVLAEGPASPYAPWFDIDWAAQGGRILLPVLGAPVGECLGELTVDGAVLRYHDHAFPLAPGTERLPLPDLLDAQHYRLAYWRVGAEEVNYRRFFDIDTLAGLRVEDPEVFDATHARVLRLLADGDVDGLRVDHPDGLADPRGYLERLAAAGMPSWVVVEKILHPGEDLPRDWACAGTTGYDAARVVEGLFVDPDGEQPLTDLYVSLTGAPAAFAEVVQESKRLVTADVLAAEINRLTEVAAAVCASDIALRDHTRRWLREAVTGILVALDVYRTYLRPGEPPSPRDAAVIDRAADAARRRLPRRCAEIDLVRRLLLDGTEARTPPGRDQPAHPRGPGATADRRGEFVTRFQQTSAAVTAKGVEDTAFYRWFRLSSLNEVGGDPDRFGADVTDFHAYCSLVQRDRPATMTSLSTHDSKRSEDVRARLAVLAEMPGEWGRTVTAWRAATGHGPDPNAEYLLWQTLVGAWPISRERVEAFMLKAVREAKRHTAWTDVNEAYERGLRDHIGAIFADEGLLGEVAAFAARIAGYGWSNALAQKVVQLAMPGVPDMYQGTELWQLSLVDPDNRRPVDFEHRMRPLATLHAGGVPAVDASGVAKLHAVSRTLRLRREHPEWFGAGAGYEPLYPRGPAAGHAVAFGRGGSVVCVATRLPVRLEREGGWRGTALELPAGTWTDALTGRAHSATVALAELLDDLPVALLHR